MPIKKNKRIESNNRLKPEDTLSKYKSYSEEELLGNIDAKKPNYEIPEENTLYNMPIYKPKDVAPPKSFSDMPSEEYLRRRYQLELKDGGLVSRGQGRVIKIKKTKMY
jgi:hypothetical protein